MWLIKYLVFHAGYQKIRKQIYEGWRSPEKICGTSIHGKHPNKKSYRDQSLTLPASSCPRKTCPLAFRWESNLKYNGFSDSPQWWYPSDQWHQCRGCQKRSSGGFGWRCLDRYPETGKCHRNPLVEHWSYEQDAALPRAKILAVNAKSSCRCWRWLL